MDHLACVDLPHFPLQQLLRGQPSWQTFPVAVVDKDGPQGKLLWVNEKAWRARVRPGQRYAAALSIHPQLHAGVVAPSKILEEIEDLTRQLRSFSPRVEACQDEPGVFWLDASGLQRLYPDLLPWSREIQRYLGAKNLNSSIAVGFSRFATYATARTWSAYNGIGHGRPKSPHQRKRSTIPNNSLPAHFPLRPKTENSRYGTIVLFEDSFTEAATLAKIPLERLGFPPKTKEIFARLAIHTIGEFSTLPPEGLNTRFGKEVHRLHRMALGREWDPLSPKKPNQPLLERLLFDEAVRDRSSLLFSTRRLLGPLLEALADKNAALLEFEIRLKLEKPLHPGARDARPLKSVLKEKLRPAEPTLQEDLLLDLARLRLDRLKLGSGVKELEISVVSTPASREQLALFTRKPKRELRAANRALARLRAELGDHAVLRTTLREAHLPEASLTWEPLSELVAARPKAIRERTLVRRIALSPKPLPIDAKRQRDVAWQISPVDHASITGLAGPYILSGGWWKREVCREYHFAETTSGEVLWTFYDKWRRRWFLHGTVE